MKFVEDESGRRVAVEHIVWYRGVTNAFGGLDSVQARTVLGQDHIFNMTMHEFELLVGAREEARPGD